MVNQVIVLQYRWNCSSCNAYR